MKEIINFSAGPAILPKAVLEKAREELLDFRGQGMSILEMSHRSKGYEAVNQAAEKNMKDLLELGEDYRVLFLQGGASTQFAMVPMNFLAEGKTADYILTGSWAEKAMKEAKLFGKVHVAATTAEGNYRRIPRKEEVALSENPAYVHITSNNTIFGTQWQELPDFGEVPMVADMSSDMLSRVFDAQKFALIYAGAQKNLGPAGVTAVVIRKDMLGQNPKHLPTMLRYDTHSDNDSLYNTPPVFAVYLLNLVLEWVKEQGGVAAVEKRNREKAALIYDVIDNSGGFYTGHGDRDSRSMMNITFRLPDEEKEKSFLTQAAAGGLDGLKGHRSVGGLRASVYNAMPREGCAALAEFMKDFMKIYG